MLSKRLICVSATPSMEYEISIGLVDNVELLPSMDSYLRRVSVAGYDQLRVYQVN